MENFQTQKEVSALKKYLNYYRSLLALGVFVFVFFVWATSAQAANLFLSPGTGNYEVGKTFSVSVLVSSSNQAMNAASGVISFPKDKLEVISISKSGSIFSLWAQEPSFSNNSGSINFEGIIMNPGFSGASGKIITINFKTKAAGTATLNFSSGSVLANDGLGTNILNGLSGAKLNILGPAEPVKAPVVETSPVKDQAPTSSGETANTGATPIRPAVSSTSHPDQEKWYSNNNLEISWKLPAGVNGESVYFSQSPNSNLASISDGVFTSKSYNNIKDGIWYFHIKFRNQSGWGETAHFRVQVDSAAPKPFDIEIIDGQSINDVQVKLLSDIIDDLSGIDYYTIEYGNNNLVRLTPAEISQTLNYHLPLLDAGQQQLKFTAYDKAGNATSISKKFTVVAPPASPEQSYSQINDDEATISEMARQPKPTLGLANLFFEAGSWLIKIMVILIPLFALLLFLAFVIIYGWYKFHHLNIKAADELRLAKKKMQKELIKAQDDIKRRIDILEKNRERRRREDLAEMNILDNLRRELANLEKPDKVIKVPMLKKGAPTPKPKTRIKSKIKQN